MKRLANGGLILVVAAGASLAACSKTPGGQVVATVDGQEITRRDLLAELRAVGGRSEADLQSMQGGLASLLVDRQLLVEEAKREKLDKNPEFLAAEQRQRSILLASMLAQSFNARIQKPTAAAVQQFVSANPLMFAGRKLMAVSEINVPAKGVDPKALAAVHGQQAVLDYLRSKNLKPAVRTTTLDTLVIPKPLTEKLLSMPAGEPLAISNGTTIVFTTVLNTRDAPVPADQQAKVAENVMMQQAAGKQIQDQVQQLRGAADIKYLPGFEPPKPPPQSSGTL